MEKLEIHKSENNPEQTSTHEQESTKPEKTPSGTTVESTVEGQEKNFAVNYIGSKEAKQDAQRKAELLAKEKDPEGSFSAHEELESIRFNERHAQESLKDLFVNFDRGKERYIQFLKSFVKSSKDYLNQLEKDLRRRSDYADDVTKSDVFFGPRAQTDLLEVNMARRRVKDMEKYMKSGVIDAGLIAAYYYNVVNSLADVGGMQKVFQKTFDVVGPMISKNNDYIAKDIESLHNVLNKF